ncbi:APC family permease [Cryptosporangium arvum]|uniref:APC family permease n=1 Tax=Cryptosporangium arvum TaxID=80871 RepID=UPI000561577B|nr:APC family permease [Cryptosporangium arvum]
MSTDTSVSAPARRSRPRPPLGIRHLTLLLVMTHAPLLLVWSTVSGSYQIGGVVATPLVFLIAGLLMLIVALGYGGMARRIHHRGGVYAFIAHGLGRTPALVASAVLIASYVSVTAVVLIYSGQSFSQLGTLLFGWEPPLVAGAIAGAVLAAGLAALPLRIMLRVLSGLAVVQLAAIGWLDVAALREPAGGAVTTASLDPGWLLTGSFGLALCLSMTSYIGSETGGTYSRDVVRPERTVPIATLLGYTLTTLVLVFSGWALSTATGAEQAVLLARLSAADTKGLSDTGSFVLAVVGGLVAPEHLERTAELLLTALFLGIVSSMAALHSGLSRQLSALGAEGVLPRSFAARGTSTPTLPAKVTGLTLSTVAAMVAILTDDRGVGLALAVTGGLGVLAVLCVASLAAAAWFLRRDDVESGFFGWEGQVTAASVGAIVTACVFVFGCFRLPEALGAFGDVVPGWFPLAYLSAALGTGLVWVVVVRTARPNGWLDLGRQDIR